MPDAPIFSLEAVNALLPRLRELVGEQIERRSRIEAKLSALTKLLGDTPEILEPTDGDSAEVASIRAEAKQLVIAYRAGWQEVEAMGAVVKDPRRGLVDFYGRVDGQLVWLCWMYDEAEVAYYHGLEEGFPGRRAIAGTVKQHLLN
jgi:hypothetical protein